MSSEGHLLPKWEKDVSEPMSFEGFLCNVLTYLTRHPEQRIGQGLFNVLYMVRPDLSEQIRATELDPFNTHDWNMVVRVLAWIGLHWPDEVPDA